MNITLRPELQKRIEEHVRNGEFRNAEDMVEQAVAFFLDSVAEEDSTDLEEAIREGLEQADRGETISLEEFDRQMRKKYGIPR